MAGVLEHEETGRSGSASPWCGHRRAACRRPTRPTPAALDRRCGAATVGDPHSRSPGRCLEAGRRSGSRARRSAGRSPAAIAWPGPAEPSARRRWRTSRRRAAWTRPAVRGGGTPAESTSTSRSTASGRAAASLMATRPPNEWATIEGRSIPRSAITFERQPDEIVDGPGRRRQVGAPVAREVEGRDPEETPQILRSGPRRHPAKSPSRGAATAACRAQPRRTGRGSHEPSGNGNRPAKVRLAGQMASPAAVRSRGSPETVPVRGLRPN